MKALLLLALAAVIGAHPAIAGENPSAKLAMHVVASSEYLDCGDLIPAACDSINVDASIAEILAAGGYGYVAFVAYDVEGVTGAEFAVTGWPTGRSAPSLSGPHWCPDDALTMGDHLGTGGITSFSCEQASGEGLVLIGYCSFGPLDEEDLPITLEYAASDFSYPNDPHNCVLDCTIDYQEDSLVAVTGCMIGGTHEGQPDCMEELGSGSSSGPWNVEIVQVIEIAAGDFMAPAWSPDGAKVAFTRSQFTGLFVRNADGTGPIVELSTGASAGYRPVWAPDSRAILLQARTGRMCQSLQLADVESGEITELAGDLRNLGGLRINNLGDLEFRSARGLKVLDMASHRIVDADTYDAETGETSWDFDLDGRTGHLSIRSADGARHIDFPHAVGYYRVSPNRDKIAFVGYHGGLFVSNIDGSNLLHLCRGSSPEWSSSGRFLAFGVSEDDGHRITGSELFVADTHDGRVVQITHTPDVHEMFASWSPDGRKIAYDTENEGKIYVGILRWAR